MLKGGLKESCTLCPARMPFLGCKSDSMAGKGGTMWYTGNKYRAILQLLRGFGGKCLLTI